MQFYLNMFRWEDIGKLKVTGFSSHVNLFFDWLEEVVKQYTTVEKFDRKHFESAYGSHNVRYQRTTLIVEKL